MQAKKIPALRGSKAGNVRRMPDNFTLVMPIGADVIDAPGRYTQYKTESATTSVAHPARPMARTGQFEPETTRVMQQSDAEWLAEYDGADSLVKPGVSGIVGEGATNTQEDAVATPTESGVSFRPEFADPAQCRIRGYGRDGVKRKPTRTASSVLVTSCPPSARTKAFGAFKSQDGAIMATANSTTTGASAQITHAPSTGNTHHDHHHQAELLFRASNHLALALHQLRNATGDQGIKTAAGRANAAARALNQLAGGARHG